jgi:hypothetical protein
MKKILTLLISLLFIAGCTKMEDKKSSNTDKTTMPNTEQKKDPHTGMNMQQTPKDSTPDMDNAPSGTKDAKAEELSKTAFDFDKVYEKNKNDDNKKKYIDKHLAAGLYLTYEANLNPKEKYGPALKHFRKVLEVDPQNQEAMQNKQQIEDIYTSMGRQIPE